MPHSQTDEKRFLLFYSISFLNFNSINELKTERIQE